MAVSKKLTAIFAGLLLAGSFGLAGCDDSGSSDTRAGSSDTGANNPKVDSDSSSTEPSGSNSTKSNPFGGKYPVIDDCENYTCFKNSKIKIPSEHNNVSREKYEEYRDLFEADCSAIENDGTFVCSLDNGSITLKIVD